VGYTLSFTIDRIFPNFFYYKKVEKKFRKISARRSSGKNSGG
jgi:hypothetical protein